MRRYILLDALVAETQRMQDAYIAKLESRGMGHEEAVMASISYVNGIKDVINTLEVKEIGVDLGDPKGDKSAKYIIDTKTLEVKDPYEQTIQYSSIEDGIKAHAETYSFNIESHLFPQLTKEQQALWRKEIEQACISGGEVGVELAKVPRYKENLEVKEMDFDAEWKRYFEHRGEMATVNVKHLAKYFFELGMAVSNKAQKGE